MKVLLSKIAETINGKIIGNKNLIITGVAEIENAKSGDIIFISDSKYFHYLQKTKASAAIINKALNLNFQNLTYIEVENPYLAYAQIVEKFIKFSFKKSIHPTVIIGKNSIIKKNVSIGPYVVIGKNVQIDNNVIIFSHTYIGNDVKIDANTIIYNNVSIMDKSIIGKKVIIHSGVVIGSDGFRYIKIKDKHHKIPHIGNVIIEDEVEIGSNTTIDRSILGSTIIKSGTKIDNLVQVAHNVEIGKNSVIAAQVGIAGSVKIGENVTIAGQAGIADHLIIGNNTIITAKAGVIQNIADNSIVSGFPAKSHLEEKKNWVLLKHLPKLYKKVADLEKNKNNH